MNTQIISTSELIPAGIHINSSTILSNKDKKYFNQISARTDDKCGSKPSKNTNKKNWKENLEKISKLKESNNLKNNDKIHDQSNMYLYAIIK